MNLKSQHVGVALTALLTVPAAATAQSLTPGLYEYTMKMSMAGAPPLPAQTMRHCVTPKDVEANKAFQMPQDNSTDCQIKNHTQSGGQFSYVMSCTKPQKMESVVKGSYTANSITMDMTATVAGAPGPMMQNISAKRVGDCK